MKKIMKLALAGVFAGVAGSAAAVQETFTDMGPLDCTRVTVCQQATGDQLFVLRFQPAYPWSAPSPQGFELRERVVEVRNANGGLLDLNIMAASLAGSNAYNGNQFIGAVRLDVQDGTGGWTTASQWSSWIGSPTGIYVIFDGHDAQSPTIKGVRAVRLVGVNGATALLLGMMNLTPH